MATNDAHTMMLFEANKKSAGIAYALWFFMGMLGAHRFYAGRTGSGSVMLILFIVGIVTLGAGVGGILLAIDAICALVDVFLISGWIKSINLDLVAKLTGTSSIGK